MVSASGQNKPKKPDQSKAGHRRRKDGPLSFFSGGRLFIVVLLALLLVASLTGNFYLLQGKTEKEELALTLAEDMADLEEEKAELARKVTALEDEMQALENELEDMRTEEALFTMKGMVEVRDIDPDIEVALAYASEDNFTGEQLYPVEVCLLRKKTAKKLASANEQFKKDGYRLKIWDAYRPLRVQEKLWQHFQDPVYVADPQTGSNHNRGAAVDVTLVDDTGEKLEMPTGFDVFTREASRGYPGMSAEARKNMEYLTAVMVENGFTPIESEWWHFNDEDVGKYDLLDLCLSEFASAYFER